MTDALQDEYHAEWAYQDVLDAFGNVKPFTSIHHAELNHIDAASKLFTKRGLAVPESDWLDDAPLVFASVTEACEAGVEAEVANIAMYEELLKSDLPDDVVKVFTKLMEASRDSHLPAFHQVRELSSPRPVAADFSLSRRDVIGAQAEALSSNVRGDAGERGSRVVSIVILAPSRMRVVREWRQQPEGGDEMRPESFVKAALVACLVLVSFAMAAPAALGQGRPGGGGGGGHTEAAVNNLSYPALMVAGTGSPAVSLSATSHVLGTTYSYGCDKPEMVGTFSYPNTSCLAPDGVTHLTAAACTLENAPCAGLTVNRIYWQKVSTSYWKAYTAGPAMQPITVDFVDWGDNLESKSWTATSIVRVETTPFEDHGLANLMRGYQMWHVSGQGTTEQWGLRVTEDPLTFEPVAAYGYDSQYSIVNTGNARLNIAKLSPTADACPSATARRLTRRRGSATSGTGPARSRISAIPQS